jgi:hypothetical protein
MTAGLKEDTNEEDWNRECGDTSEEHTCRRNLHRNQQGLVENASELCV